jgi:hypothetical protein
MVSFEFLAIILTGLGLTASIVYYATVIRNQNKTRKTQLFMQLHQAKTDQKGLENVFILMNLEWANFADYMSKYGGLAGHHETAAALESWLSYFDGLGILVKEGMIDLDMVYKVAFSRILFMWFKFETIIDEFRKEPYGMPDYCQNFEYLAEKVMEIRRKKGLPLPYISEIHPTSKRYKE